MTPRRRVVAVAASVAVVIAVAIAVAVSSAGEPRDPQALPSPSRSGEALQPSPDPGDSPSASPTTSPDAAVDPDPEIDPFYGDSVVAEATNAPASFAEGPDVRLVSVTPTRVTGSGIGAANGDAVEVVVEISNATSASLDLSSVVVNGFTGDDRVPAIIAEGDSSKPFAGALKAGSTKRGVYLFGVDDPGEAFRVTVSLDADSGSVVLERR